MDNDKIFDQYARCYQAIYRDKNYNHEADYIHSLLSGCGRNRGTLLDLGCGSGEHCRRFVELGYQVHGIDLSEQMIARANRARQDWHDDIASNVQFTVGDIRTCRLTKNFDVVTSLFHVVSYQTENKDVIAAFKTVYEHLKPGGLFVFDFWYGPGVLTDRPKSRLKRYEDDKGQIVRIAEPTMYPRENLVNVEYTFQLVDQESGQLEQFTENHKVRYFFEPEIHLLLNQAWGEYEVEISAEWLTGKVLSWDSWFGIFVIRRPIS